MSSTVNKDGFKPNLETQLIPLLATRNEDVSAELKGKNADLSSKDGHHPLLMQVSFQILVVPSLYVLFEGTVGRLVMGKKGSEHNFSRAFKNVELQKKRNCHILLNLSCYRLNPGSVVSNEIHSYKI